MVQVLPIFFSAIMSPTLSRSLNLDNRNTCSTCGVEAISANTDLSMSFPTPMENISYFDSEIITSTYQCTATTNTA